MFTHAADDILSVICGRPHLWFGVSVDLAGEGDWHALKDFVVFKLLVEGWCHPLAGRVFVVLHVVV